jgi:hypothetical protein
MADTKPKLVRFVSRFREHRIVFRASYNNEVNGRVVTHPGESVRFKEGMYETDDQEIVAFLRSQPDFGQNFYEVPDNVEDVLKHRENTLKSLETRELEAELERRKAEEEGARVQEGEEGSRTSSSEGKTEDDLDSMNRAALVVVAQELKLEPSAYKVGTSNEKIKDAIRTKRAELAKADGAGEEDNGDKPAY